MKTLKEFKELGYSVQSRTTDVTEYAKLDLEEFKTSDEPTFHQLDNYYDNSETEYIIYSPEEDEIYSSRQMDEIRDYLHNQMHIADIQALYE